MTELMAEKVANSCNLECPKQEEEVKEELNYAEEELEKL